MQFSIGSVQSVRCDSCLNKVRCTIQSDETLLADPVATGTVCESETTAFMDGMEGVKVGTPAITNHLDTSDAVTAAGLTDFLKRPVRIQTFTWNESDVEGVLNTISPWNLFFNNANIKYKLNNFAFIRCNLKLKFVINASPFYYGSMRACYQPLPVFKPSTVTANALSELIPYSQQPGLWLKPQHSEGGELTLPFFYQRSYLRVQSAIDFTNMGTLRMVIYNALRSANGVTGQGVTVQVYAWAEDIELAGPSVGLAMQADEYGVGPISGPASTVARIARAVKGVPIIGKFATATEMGAKAVAGIAKLFGFTNVPVIEPTQPYRPSPFPQLASSELGFPVEKLTFDSKNELSIDPSMIGLGSEDELAIEKFCTRESYLTTSTWTTATAVDTPIFTSRVSPMIVGPNSTFQQFTPMSVAALMFHSWRGDVIFTFRFIASPFHRGRVRISYDPFGDSVQTLGDTGATVFNKVVDLSSETEVDIRVPYQQALAFQRVTTLFSDMWTTSATPTLTYSGNFDNGVISVKVLTLLSAPVATSTVSMQVFVKGAENLEFANPREVDKTLSPFVLQADEYAEVRDSQEVDMGSNDGGIELDRYRLNYGECIRSLRHLLRRSNYIDTIKPASDVLNSGYTVIQQYRFPQAYGYDSTGWGAAYGQLVPASIFGFNYTKTTPWHIISNCFVAHRGSAHWHYNVEGPSPTTMLARRAGPGSFNTIKISNFGYNPATANWNTVQKFYLDNGPSTAGGAALTNQLTASGLSVGMPNYTQFKFESTYPKNFSTPPTGNSEDGSSIESFELFVDYEGTGVNPSRQLISRYFAVGTDYNLYFFLNCPTLTRLDPANVIPG